MTDLFSQAPPPAPKYSSDPERPLTAADARRGGPLFSASITQVIPLDGLPDLSRYDMFSVDTETRGLDFHGRPVGMSIATPDGKSWYLSWGHEGGGNNTTLEAVRQWAAVELTRPNQLKIFFNAPFDLRMLAYVGIEVRGPIEDASTVCALLNERERSFALDRLAEKYIGEGKDEDYLRDWIQLNFGSKNWKDNIWRAPGNIVSPYAMADTDRTLRLWQERRPLITTERLDDIYAIETALIPIIVQMHLHGVRVNREAAMGAKGQLGKELDTAIKRWNEIAPGVNAISSDQVAEVFRAHGLRVGRTGKGKDSINKKLLEQIIESDETDDARTEVATLVRTIRELTKFAGTFVENYVLANADRNSLIHGEFHPLGVEYKPGKKYGTVSGRFSSGGALNLQNFPGDQKPIMKKLIRGLFVPYYDGMDWMKADYSQIEYRYLAHYAGDPLKTAYLKNPNVDFHQMVADLINNPICPRPRAKNVNFAIAFGSSVKTAAATAGIEVEQMEEIFEIYHQKTEGCIKNLSKQVKKRADERGYIITWGGRRRRFMSRDEAIKLGWEVRPWERYMETHKALNALIQGSAADLLKKAMIRVAQIVDWKNTFLHLTVHDELDFSIPKGEEGAKFRKQVRECMEDWPLSVPIRVDLETGPDWGHTVEHCRDHDVPDCQQEACK